MPESPSGVLEPVEDVVPRRARGNPWWTLVAVALGVTMVGLDGTVVSIANPAIATDLHATLAGLQWVTNGYLLALAVSLIIAGRLADRFGRKRLFLVGVLLFAVASALVGLSGSIGPVIFWRVVQGFAGAMLQPASLAILRKAFPADKLNMAIGIWGGSSALSIASGPIVGGLLVEHVGWQSVFFINIPVGAITLLIGALVIRESRDPDAGGSFDFAGVVLLAGSLFCLVWGLIKAAELGFGDALPLGFIVAAVVLGALFVLRERVAAQPLLPLRLFRSVSLSAATVLVTLAFFALFGALFFLTLYLQQVHGRTPVRAGVELLPLTSVFIVSSPLAGFLTSRLGPRPVLMAGMLLNAVAMFGLSRLGVDSPYSHLWPWFVLLGFGFGFVIVSGTEAVVGNAPVELGGVAGGLQQTGMQLGGVLGTTVFGTVMATRVGDVLFAKLTGAGLPPTIARQLDGAKEYVAQGVAPIPPGAPASVAQAIRTGSHLAFLSGFSTSLVIAGIVSVIAAAGALLVRRGANAGGGPALL
ncbi:MAG TPA: MFS transporter [Pseudonocardiaceae bacterium]|jgi:EmrB/QacA subfamily drug resistance transporter